MFIRTFAPAMCFVIAGCVITIENKDIPESVSGHITLEENAPIPEAFKIELETHHAIKKEKDGLRDLGRERAHLRTIDLMGTYGRKHGEEVLSLAERNYWVTSYYRNVESKYYPSRRNVSLAKHYNNSNGSKWPENLPRFCLAMSGGGVRSAAFNIGVLQALNEKRFVDQIDVISGASGGAYALSWLYSNLTFDPRITPSTVLNEKAPSFKYLNITLPFLDFEQAAALGATTAAFLPLTIPLEKLSGGLSLYMPGGLNLAYVAKLELTFQANQSVTIGDIRDMVTNKIVPLPVINVTALRDLPYAEENNNCNNLTCAPLSELVFEHTPFRRGNYAFGFTDKYPHGPGDKSELLLSQIVAMSGAALDKPGALYYDVLKIAALYTGAREGFISAPLLYTQPKQMNVAHNANDSSLYGTQLYYTDAGHSENLGAYSLIRRLCSDILIIDAEEDPRLLFESYLNLKNRLSTEHDLVLKVPGVEELKQTSTPACKKMNAWNDKCFKARAIDSNGFTGTISSIPYRNADNNSNTEYGLQNLTIHVRYLKLGMNIDRLREYSPEVGEYYNKCRKEKHDKCLFPHDPTRDQGLDIKTFHAYRILGRDLANKYIMKN